MGFADASQGGLSLVRGNGSIEMRFFLGGVMDSPAENLDFYLSALECCGAVWGGVGVCVNCGRLAGRLGSVVTSLGYF